MSITYATAAPVMMQLGDFQFGINTAAYQGLSRSDAWRWPAQDRIGQEAALQHLGPGECSVTLDGVLYPEWKGGLGQLDAMRAQAGRGQRPVLEFDGFGVRRRAAAVDDAAAPGQRVERVLEIVAVDLGHDLVAELGDQERHGRAQMCVSGADTHVNVRQFTEGEKHPPGQREREGRFRLHEAPVNRGKSIPWGFECSRA